MARFYGWTDREIESMEACKFEQYFIALSALEAKEQIVSINSTMFPNLKQDRRSSIFKSLQKIIKDCFRVEISSVNAKYLAEQDLKNGN